MNSRIDYNGDVAEIRKEIKLILYAAPGDPYRVPISRLQTLSEKHDVPFVDLVLKIAGEDLQGSVGETEANFDLLPQSLRL